MNLPYVSAAEVVERLSHAHAADALARALRDGLDPEGETARTVVDLRGGQLMVMPSAAGPAPAVKLLTIGGEPRVQGVCVVFDPGSLAPIALIDGIALTNLRTAAVSALAARHLAAPDASRLVIFGRGAQAHAHATALAEVRPIEHTEMVGRDPDHREVERLVREADVICCCTSAREPLFDGAWVADDATVIAIGSHEPGARETDDTLAGRSTVVVEARSAALREAGDVIAAIAAGALAADELITLADLVREKASPHPGPRLFKSTGMAWEDAVIASALVAIAGD